jgi:hypothetical protein
MRGGLAVNIALLPTGPIDPIGAALITLALCAGSYLLDPPPPRVERLAGARGPIRFATVPARTNRRVSIPDRESYFSRSQPVEYSIGAGV